MSKAVRLSDIAAKLNISTVSVSKALSGQKGVSEELRTKIKELADEMGYIPIETRKNQEKHRSYDIGVLISERFVDKYQSFYSQMYQEVASTAIINGSFSIMEEVTVEAEENLLLPKILSEKKVDGYIVIGRLNREYLAFLQQESKIPSMYMDFNYSDQNANCVISDGYYGSYALTNYLFNKGHEKIGFVGTILATGSITDRFLGYTRAVLEHGQQVREDWHLKDRDLDNGNMNMNSHFVLPEYDMPTAFVCNSDLSASELIKKLRFKGYRVPEDVSVVGYDNFLVPGLCDVEITTYDVDMKEMAKKAVRNLIHKIAHDPYKKGSIIVTGRIIEKDSVKDLTADTEH